MVEAKATFPLTKKGRDPPAIHADLWLSLSGIVVSEMDINPDTWLKFADSLWGFAFKHRFNLRCCPFLLKACPAEQAEIAALFGTPLEGCKVGMNL